MNITFDSKKILAGAVSGLVAAVLVDLNAWTKAEKGAKFDVKLASKRWISGAVSGATASVGLSGFGGSGLGL